MASSFSLAAGAKRSYQSDDAGAGGGGGGGGGGGVAAASTAHHAVPEAVSTLSTFRNVSACNRCRVRKNRCDQRLPTCSSCEKAGVPCVGYDLLSKREIPRSYVYFLETRLVYFEGLLNDHGIPFDPDDVYSADCRPLGGGGGGGGGGRPARSSSSTTTTATTTANKAGGAAEWPASPHTASSLVSSSPNTDVDEVGGGGGAAAAATAGIDKLVSNISMVSVHGASDSRYLGSTSGISFARVVLAAIKSSVSTNTSEKVGPAPSKPLPLATAPAASSSSSAAGGGGGGGGGGARSMRDSYFGLQTKPTIKEAAFPDRRLADKLVHLYFEYANPQIPILHRGDFMDLVDQAYAVDPARRTARQLYWLNIVFAIGAGIIWGSSDPAPDTPSSPEIKQEPGGGGGGGGTNYTTKRQKLSSQQAQPEEYHASAIVHLGAILSSQAATAAATANRPGGELEELQAVLLLAAFALLRPVAPGLWYIVGVAMRLAVDLGLHYEDGTGIEAANTSIHSVDARERGRREWMRDLRRRLWWCTYNFDRLVSTCVGRPFGIGDQVVTTEFPSLLDDRYITPSGFINKPQHALGGGGAEPTYKLVSHHYLRLRLLQSEIVQVLQYQQAQHARSLALATDGGGGGGGGSGGSGREFMHTDMPSPFLSKFDSFREWRANIDQRLYEWMVSAPAQADTGVLFDCNFFVLNYWQAVTTLYRPSLSVPEALEGELGAAATEDVASPSTAAAAALLPHRNKDDEDLVYMKCGEAGQQTLKLYLQLHRQKLVNYTYLATHHLFMAGISFLYAVWHSPAVRSQLTMDDFDFTVLAATTVLGDLVEKCPPAEACRDAFERMSKATVQMCLSTTGFGLSNPPTTTTAIPSAQHGQMQQPQPPPRLPRRKVKRPPPQFDMDMRDLFPDDLDTARRPSQGFPFQFHPVQQQEQANNGSMAFAVPEPVSAAPSFSTHLGGMGHAGSSHTSDSTQHQHLHLHQHQHQHQQQAQPQLFGNLYGNAAPASTNIVNLPEMDFLAAQTSSNAPHDFSDIGYDNRLGHDLGFGVGNVALDFSHDWSDGQQFDLFEGFFFGNG